MLKLLEMIPYLWVIAFSLMVSVTFRAQTCDCNWVVKCTVKGETRTRVYCFCWNWVKDDSAQINTGMVPQLRKFHYTSIKFILNSSRWADHCSWECMGSLEVPSPLTVLLFSECTILPNSRKRSIWHASYGSTIPDWRTFALDKWNMHVLI